MNDRTIQVLLIETRPEDVDLVQGLLQSEKRFNYQVKSCRDWETGKSLAAEQEVDVILLGSQEPGIFQGVTVLAEGHPVILLAWKTEEDSAFQAVHNGAQDYLIKDHLDPDVISRVIRYALEESRLKKALEVSTITDDITGLRNRMGFIALSEQQIRLAERNRNKFLFLFIDVKGLKGINDTYGHAVGDQALQSAAEVIQQTFRRSDIIGRIGGDEFAVLAVKSQVNDSEFMVDRLYSNLRLFNESQEKEFMLQFSIGVSEWSPQVPKEIGTLMQEADQALYAQKNLETPKDAEVKGGAADSPTYSTTPFSKDHYHEWAESPDDQAALTHSKRILLVEDNPGDIYQVQEIIRNSEMPCKLVHVPQLSTALRQIEQGPFDLVLLDLTLPDSRGLDAIEAILTAAPDIPIIVMTGVDDLELATQALQVGAQDYLPKGSFDPVLLGRACQYAIERNKLRIQKSRYAQQLKISESRFRRIIEGNADGILILDRDSKILYANPAADAYFNQGTGGIETQPRNLPVGAREAVEIKITKPGGELLTLEMRQVEIPWQIGSVFLATLRDVTQRVMVQKALEDSEARLNSIFQNVAIGIYRTTLDGKILYANRALVKMLGFETFEGLAGRNLEESGFSRVGDRRRFIVDLETNGLVSGLESSWLKQDGTVIHVRESAKVVHDPEGQGYYYEGTVEDISPQVAAKQQILLQSAALDAADNAIFITDPKGTIIYTNPAFMDLSGYEMDEIIGRNPRFLKSGKQDAEYYRQFWQTITAGRTWQSEIINRRKNGGLYTELMTVTPLKDNEGEITHYIAIKADISARKQAEDTLVRRLNELTVLNAGAVAGVEETDEDSLITRFTEILSEIFHPDHFGVLLLSEDGQTLNLHPSYQGLPDELHPGTIGVTEGVVGPVVANRKPKRISDIRQEPAFIKTAPGIRSGLSVPLIAGERVLGVINAESTQIDAFNIEDENLLLTLASQLGTAIAKLRGQAAEREQRIRAEALSDSALALNSSLAFDQVLDQILENIARVVPYETASLMLNQNGKTFMIRYRAPGRLDYFKRAEQRMMEIDKIFTFKRMQASGEPILIPNVHHEPEWKVFDEGEWIRSYLGVPILKDDLILGFLNLDHSQPNYFTKPQAEALKALAHQIAIALENARLYERQQQQLAFLESLREIDLAITGSLDLQIILEVIMKQLVARLNVDAVNILLMDPYLLTLKPYGDTGFYSSEIRNYSPRMGNGLAGRAAKTGNVVYEADLNSIQGSCDRQRLFKSERFKTYYAFPLKAKGQIKGVLEIFGRKPFEPDSDWEDFVSTVSTSTAIALDNAQMFENLQRSFTEIATAYDTTLEGWAKALELRDQETEGHSWRVVELTLQLARMMGFGGEDLLHIRRGALLHDIGKMGVPDAILQKDGPLTEDEWREMRKHPVHAYDLLSGISYLVPTLDIPQYHHEKWNGSGYPYGLAGEKIPLPARIFAVIDVWDALLSDRPYRDAWSREKTVAYIQDQRGEHFDPRVVDAFFEMMEIG